jgi:hypothetical protein
MNTGKPSRAKTKKLHNSTTNGRMPTYVPFLGLKSLAANTKPANRLPAVAA